MSRRERVYDTARRIAPVVALAPVGLLLLAAAVIR